MKTLVYLFVCCGLLMLTVPSVSGGAGCNASPTDLNCHVSCVVFLFQEGRVECSQTKCTAICLSFDADDQPIEAETVRCQVGCPTDDDDDNGGSGGGGDGGGDTPCGPNDWIWGCDPFHY